LRDKREIFGVLVWDAGSRVVAGGMCGRCDILRVREMNCGRGNPIATPTRRAGLSTRGSSFFIDGFLARRRRRAPV
jgi:hypothetical protein